MCRGPTVRKSLAIGRIPNLWHTGERYMMSWVAWPARAREHAYQPVRPSFDRPRHHAFPVHASPVWVYASLFLSRLTGRGPGGQQSRHESARGTHDACSVRGSLARAARLPRPRSVTRPRQPAGVFGLVSFLPRDVCAKKKHNPARHGTCRVWT